tara:strand:+ start:93 stop:230 length:138 start_codon:yes stop_codon:yes gene_type:complete
MHQTKQTALNLALEERDRLLSSVQRISEVILSSFSVDEILDNLVE